MSTQRSHRSRWKSFVLVALVAGLIGVPASGIRGSSTAAASGVGVSSPQGDAGDAIGGPTTFKRLSEAQYKRTIENLFGADVDVPGRFEPSVRANGLLSVGAGKATVSAFGMEQYELRAREIAAQVMAPEKQAKEPFCAQRTQKGAAFDRACATTFFSKYGRSLYRRPLSDAELTSVLAVASDVAAGSSNFHKGLEAGLSRLLASPNFIFRVERSEPDPTRPGGSRLDSYSLAARISFLLWDSSPDVELLDAAASGALQTDAGLERQVDRLLASPRFAEGLRGFFSDMFCYDGFDGLTKDQTIYPRYTSLLANDAREQALKTLVNHLVTEKGDYRDIFTTKKTFMSRPLAALYGVPFFGGPDEWTEYAFGPEDPRAGILTLAAFLMLDPTHEGRSSPTIRGLNVREVFMCQPVPLPPAAVDFSVVNDTADAVHKTARDRLRVHSENPVCAGCHKITDPVGLALENYDAIGQFRTHENGALIDTSVEFEGAKYTNALELAHGLRETQAISSCLVQRAYEYGVGRPTTETESRWLEAAGERFAADGYIVPTLLRRIAVSKPFRTVTTVPTTIAAR
jgi:hypothetical protein